MLADGKLSGQRLGREWVIDPRDLERVRLRRQPVGRPWNASSAWALLASRLRARSELRRVYGHPAVLGRLAEEPAVVRSGVSAAADYGANIAASNEFEGYVSARKLKLLVDRYALDESAEQPNIVLHVVADRVWPFQPGAKVAPRFVVALDLLEADGERSRRAGAELAMGMSS